MNALTVRNERGVALPMALMTLMLLTTLMLAFAVLSQTEPVIAANQLRIAQARALAESGLEHAVWALSQGVIAAESIPAAPLPAGALATPLPVPTPAPFNGAVFTPVTAWFDPLIGNTSTGGYTVTVSTPDPVNRPNERLIVSTGWTPTNDPADARTKGHRTIQATFERLPNMGLKAPCALCVKGDLGVGGNSTIDSTLDTSCGNKQGTYSAGRLNGLTDPAAISASLGSAEIKGADGNTNSNDATDYTVSADPATFKDFTLTPSNLNYLKKLAKANGTYFGPGFSGATDGTTGEAVAGTYSGSVHLSAGNQVKNGIVFVDTISGDNIGTPPNPSDFGSLRIDGSPFLAGDFQGWIVVNGSLTISGNMKINGLVYAQNDFTYNGTGAGEINGLAISQNVYDTDATSVSSDDTLTRGNSRIKFNCANTRQLNIVPQGFALQAGTYRETQD
ncbi:MAG TPA: hypothetical protein VGU22_16800 [Methylomirabilota bacterium]|jgi:hypothetical protein|nr:hypothetical protein [Methylomirabilota bacterium]